MKKDFYYPIPKANLIARFKPAFSRVTKGQNATLLSLPHTGKTSHLRFICSDDKLLVELGKTANHSVIFLDVDRTDAKFESFALELLFSLNRSQNIPSLYSTDTYIITSQILSAVEKISQSRKIIFVVTIKESISSIASQIDALFVHIRKVAPNSAILWNIDTPNFRNYKTGHPSSSIYENIFLNPTFSKEETTHSIIRHSLAVNKETPDEIINNAQQITGGVAAFFHSYINFYDPAESEEKFRVSIFETDYSQKVIRDLKSEKEIDPMLFAKLCTNDLLNLLQSQFPTKTSFKMLDLTVPPTAQEIQLLNLFIENESMPVSRDTIAQTLWGKAWNGKYSDWAIDKAVSRLRTKLKSPDWKIITVKNLGYQLIKLI